MASTLATPIAQAVISLFDGNLGKLLNYGYRPGYGILGATLIDWTPADLFLLGEQGVWYDPSDIDRYMGSLGPELVINGDFSAGSTGWTASAGTIAAVSGEMQVTNSGVSYGTGYQSLTTLVGKTYKVTLTAYAGTANTVYAAAKNALLTNPDLVAVSTSSKTSVPLTFSFTATGTTTLIVFVNSNQGNATGYFDDISVKEANFGNTATMYQDAAGTTPVTAVEQPVGLILDKSKGLVLGPELVTNGGFDSGATGWTSNSNTTNSVVSGKLVSISSTTDASQHGPYYVVTGLTVGKNYKFTIGALTGTASDPRCYLGSFTAPNAGTEYGSNTQTSRMFSAVSTTLTIFPFSNGGVIGSTVIIDNISVRELPGNHATQATSTKRPVLSARVNLLTKTEDFSDAVWTKAASTATSTKLQEDATNARHYIRQTTYASGSVTLQVKLKAAERTSAVVTLSDLVTGDASVLVNLSTGATSAGGATISGPVGSWTGISYSAQDIGNSEWLVKLSATRTAGTGIYPTIYAVSGGTATYTGSAGSGLFMRDIQLETGSTATPYQRVNTATDYDTVGFKHYLKFDGVDDALATGSIDFTATDKMTVVAGVRKLSDAAAAVLCELSDISGNGWFNVAAPAGAGAQKYYFGSKGTVLTSASTTSISYNAPNTGVITGIASIGTDVCTLRINGVQAATSAADQGTGNYGNYPLYIGARAGTSLRFNGHLYSLIVRGAQSTDAQIVAAETWVNNKTGAY